MRGDERIIVFWSGGAEFFDGERFRDAHRVGVDFPHWDTKPLMQIGYKITKFQNTQITKYFSDFVIL
ncbi:MAG: hypothetical protein JWM59_1434 [Verrucomicrobiales bacterium]|nr:hypothetical protein [Verrucomicrobiales bacterium]